MRRPGLDQFSVVEEIGNSISSLFLGCENSKYIKKAK
jgi:hypothetical protein